MDLQLIVYCLLLGTVLGFLAGLLGIGGGMIMVPFMMQILANKGLSSDYLVKVAVATSLTTILFTSLSSVRAHHKAGAVRWDLVMLMAPGIIIGALLGAQFVGVAPARWLEFFFGLFLMFTAMTMLRKKKPLASGVAEKTLPSRNAVFGVGTLIGVVSAMVGAGGGFMTVPFLSNRGVRLQSAVATSAACGVPIAFGGALGYIWAGRNLDLAPGTLGYLYLPGLALISAASVLTAPFGARIAHRTDTAKLKKSFGLMLLALGAYMFWHASRSWQD